MKIVMTKAAACLLTVLLCMMSLAAMPAAAAETVQNTETAVLTVVNENGVKETVSLHCHLATSVMGTEITGKVFYQYIPVYPVFTLKTESGSYYNGAGFTTKFTVYDPDGTEDYTISYDSGTTFKRNDSNLTLHAGYCCIYYKPLKTGTYKFSVTLSGTVTGTVSYAFSVHDTATKFWVSDSPMGDSAGGMTNPIPSGSKTYLCYNIYDTTTNETVENTFHDYHVKLTFNAPNGEVFNQTFYDTDSFKEGYSAAYSYHAVQTGSLGKWTGQFELGGSVSNTQERTWYVGTYEPIIISESSAVGDDKFTWGKDNWSFGNSASAFTTDYDIDSDTMDAMLNAFPLSNTDRELMKIQPHFNSFHDWGGSCYGMTVAEILTKQGLLSPSDFGLKSVLNQNTNTASALSLINFLYSLQDIPLHRLEDRMASERRYYETTSQAEYIKKLEEVVQQEGVLVNLCYAIAQYSSFGTYIGDGGHSVLAYGMQSGSYYINGKKYDRRILIADPNYLDENELTDRACLYYDSTDYSWIIPYQNNGTYECRWNADEEKVKNTTLKHGYIKNIFVNTGLGDLTDLMNEGFERAKEYYPGITIVNSTQSRELFYYRYTDSANPPETPYFEDNKASLASRDISQYRDDYKSAYEVFCKEDEDGNTPLDSYEFAMDHQHYAYIGKLENVTNSYFHPAGYFEAIGEDMTYSVNMVANEDYTVTDWYSVTVSGTGVNHIAFKKVSKGYIVTLDNPHSVTVEAHNSTDTATRKVSYMYSSFMIYEIDPNTIGIRLDTDYDGIYESYVDPVAGDVNQDLRLDLSDAVLLSRYLSEDSTIYEWQLKKVIGDDSLADLNSDDQITMIDFRLLLKILSE